MMRLFAIVVRVLFALIVVTGSLVGHIASRVGRIAVRDILAQVLPVAVPGTLRIGSVDVLTPRDVRVSRVSFVDDRGAPVLEDATVTVRDAWRVVPALLQGRDFPAITVRAHRAWARVPWFTPAPPPRPAAAGEAPATPASVSLPALDITVDALEGALPGVPLHGRGLHVMAGLRLANNVVALDLRGLGAVVDAMHLGDERVEGDAHLRLADSPHVDADLRLRGDALNCDASVHTDPQGRMTATLHDCVLRADALDRLAGRDRAESLAIATRITEATAQGTPGSDWTLHVRAAVNDQPLELDATAGPTHQVADLRVHHLSLDRVVRAAVPGDLDGVVHAEHTADGDAHDLVLDTAGLVAAVQEVPVPPLRVVARVEQGVLRVRELTARDVGLSAEGSVNLTTGDVNFRAAADIEARDVARYPWVNGRASGSLRAHVDVDGHDGVITARLRGGAQHLRLPAARLSVADAEVTASATHRLARDGSPAATQVVASVDARQLQVPGAVGPSNVSVRAEGDPRGRLRASVSASGDGLLAALGPARTGTPSGASVRADVDVDLSDGANTRVRLLRSDLRLRGAGARVTGDVALLQAADGRTRPPGGHVRIETTGHGSADVTLAGNHLRASLHALDLAWFRPFVGALQDVEGVLDGTADVDPARLDTSRAAIHITRGRQRLIGGFQGEVTLTPDRGASELHATVVSDRGAAGREPRVDLTARIATPRRTDSPDAWLAGVDRARLTVGPIDLSAWNDLLPPAVAMRGLVSASVEATRAQHGMPLVVTTRLDVADTTAGIGTAGRMVFPATVPLALRAVACVSLERASLEGASVQTRIALGPSPRGGLGAAEPRCEDEAALLPRAWVALRGALAGPWLSGLRSAATELAARGHRLTPATEQRLRAATAQLQVDAGPLRMSEWPLRAIPHRDASGALRFDRMRPPALPDDAQVSAQVTARGALMGLEVNVEATAQASAFPQAGLSDALLAQAYVSVVPRDHGALLGPVDLTANTNLVIAPDATPDARDQVIVDVRAHGEGAAILDDPNHALSLDRFDVETERVRIERFAVLRERGLRGATALRLRHRPNTDHVLDLDVTLGDLRARLGGAGTNARETEPLQVGLHAKAISRGPHGWTLRACADATMHGDTTPCDPLQAQHPDDDTLRAVVEVPVEGELTTPRFALERSSAVVYARALQLDRVAPIASGVIAGARGALDADVRWEAAAPEPLRLDVTVADFRTRFGAEGDAVRETAPLQLGIHAKAVARDEGGWTLRTCLDAAQRVGGPPCDPLVPSNPTGEALRLTATLPVDGTLTAPHPAPERLAASVFAHAFHLETLTPLVRSDTVAGIGGALDADLRWEASRPAAFGGQMRVSGGYADVVALGERLRELEFGVHVDGTRVLIDDLRFVLGRGNMNVTGGVDLAGLLQRSTPGATATDLADLRLHGVAHSLPMGVEGNTYGWIDGDIDFNMDFGAQGANGELVVDRASVLLKEEQSRDVQALGADPDVFIVGRTVLASAPTASAYPLTLAFRLPSPVWLRRSDLAVAIQGHGQVSRERAGWGVAGTIETAGGQGWFSVLGKRFELDRLRVVLDGSVTINPQLDIAAHHDTVTGDRLTATVGGRLRTPRMEFASVNNPGASQAEVLAMIALGRSDSQGATSSSSDLGQQAGAAFASLVGAMTFGTLSRGLSFVPTLVLEPGQGSSGRYGAGVNLGPRFYLQATYGAATSAFGQSSSTAQVFRVLLEVALTQAWSMSVAASGGRAGDSAQGGLGVDVFWSP